MHKHTTYVETGKGKNHGEREEFHYNKGDYR